MSYASVSDVQQLMATFSIGSLTKPTTTQVTQIVLDVSNEIDVRLSSKGFTTPVTTPQYFVDWLGLVNGYGAAAIVLKSMFPDPTGDAENPAFAFFEGRYQDFLKGVADGSIAPVEASLNANTVLPSTYLTANPDSDYALGDQAEPLFTIAKAF